jgi:endonuclease I
MKLLQFKISIVLILLLFGFSIPNIWAQTSNLPAGYYDNAEGLSGVTLKTALYNIIDNHTSVSYSALWTHFQTSDKKANGKVWDMYSDGASYEFTFGSDQCGNYSGESDCYNREHSFPKSWFNNGYPMYTDMFHLYPTDGYVNGRRSNYPFGEVGSASWTSENGSKLGSSSYPGYTGTVFEPIDEYKGDFARSYFYMVTRYEDVITSWPGSDMLDGSKFPAFTEWAESLLIEWSNADPVSDKELNRNDAIFTIQQNRNPFIDHPEYVAQIWGGDSPSLISNITLLPENPGADDAVSISATISDADGIASATLKWGISSDNLAQSIIMSASGAIYTSNTNIPAQADESTVYYQIVAIDNESTTTNSPVYNYVVGSTSPVSLVLLDEDFESTNENQSIVLNGWMNYIETGTVSWESLLYNSNRYAQISSYQSGEQNTVWLITPAINLDLSKDENFSFDVNVGYWKQEGLSILLSSNFDGNHVVTASWTDVTSNFTIPTTPTNSYGTFTNAGTMDLSAYTGTIYLAFKYQGDESGTNTNTTTYQIDNVLIQGYEIQVDTIAPQLTPTPANGAANIAINTQIHIDANEALRDSSGNALTVDYIKSVVNLWDGNQASDFTVSLAENDMQIQIISQNLLKYSTNYTLAVVNHAFSDASGNTTALVTSNFTTVQEIDTLVSINIEALSKLNSRENSNLYIFPNPNTGIFYLKIPQTKTEATLNVYALDGRLVYSKAHLKSDALVTINMEQKGNYIINLITNHEVLVKLVVVD